MKVKILRVDTSLPLPEYKTEGAAAVDLYSRIDMEIPPKELALIPSNVIIQTPPGYMLVVVPRSSTPKKFGLSIPHGIGIIDEDFRGPDDEIKIQVYNFTNKPVRILTKQRIAQAVFVRIERAEWEEIERTNAETRGAFGSTGHD